MSLFLIYHNLTVLGTCFQVTATILKGLASGDHSTTRDSNYKDLEKQISCMVVSNNDEYILSTSGREVSLRKTKKTFEVIDMLI